jgi:hypothetical protein
MIVTLFTMFSSSASNHPQNWPPISSFAYCYIQYVYKIWIPYKLKKLHPCKLHASFKPFSKQGIVYLFKHPRACFVFWLNYFDPEDPGCGGRVWGSGSWNENTADIGSEDEFWGSRPTSPWIQPYSDWEPWQSRRSRSGSAIRLAHILGKTQGS